jgi:hypothetical protein
LPANHRRLIVRCVLALLAIAAAVPAAGQRTSTRLVAVAPDHLWLLLDPLSYFSPDENLQVGELPPLIDLLAPSLDGVAVRVSQGTSSSGRVVLTVSGGRPRLEQLFAELESIGFVERPGPHRLLGVLGWSAIRTRIGAGQPTAAADDAFRDPEIRCFCLETSGACLIPAEARNDAIDVLVQYAAAHTSCTMTPASSPMVLPAGLSALPDVLPGRSLQDFADGANVHARREVASCRDPVGIERDVSARLIGLGVRIGVRDAGPGRTLTTLHYRTPEPQPAHWFGDLAVSANRNDTCYLELELKERGRAATR